MALPVKAALRPPRSLTTCKCTPKATLVHPRPTQTSTMTIKHLAVFCGASAGVRPEYGEAARELGKVLASEEIGLVYGGGTVGLMGEVANTVLQLSGPQAIYGVIPKSMVPRELSGEMIGEVVVVDDMHTRKALMAKRADGFIGLPGGFGTLEELLEVITWQQLGFHAKPIGLLNIQGFYDPLLTFFQHCVDQGFIRSQHKDNLIVSTDPHELITRMQQFKPHVSLLDLQRMSANGAQAVGMDVSGASMDQPDQPQQQQ